jgi:molybdopterin/thiamine biosynthesis adenylyltransferase
VNGFKPKKKSTVHISKLGDCFYIGGSGTVSEVADPTGCVDYLFQVMNGHRTLDEIHGIVKRAHPAVTYEELCDAVAQFDRAGFLENGAFTPDGLLDQYELARWERNIDFLGAFRASEVNKYELQHRLKMARVAILGLGGLGSHLLYDVAAVGVQDIRAVEFDRLELSNFNRQILYSEADVGRLKAELSVERIRAFSPRLKIDVVPMRLSSVEDVARVIHDREYVLCVADRPEMEIIRWVNEACVRTGATLISGGLDTPRGVYWSMIPGTTGCVECWQRQVQERDPLAAALLEEQRRPGRAQYGGDNTSFVPLVGLLAAYMLSDLVRMVTDIAPPVSPGRLFEVDFGSMETRQAERWDKVPSCPICKYAVPRSADQTALP